MSKKLTNIETLSPEVIEFHSEICEKMEELSTSIRELAETRNKIEALVIERGLKKAGVDAGELKDKAGMTKGLVNALLDKLQGLSFSVYGKKFTFEPKPKTETFSYKGFCAEQLEIDEDVVATLLKERKSDLPVIEIKPTVKAV